jgi:hypothetical protein
VNELDLSGLEHSLLMTDHLKNATQNAIQTCYVVRSQMQHLIQSPRIVSRSCGTEKCYKTLLMRQLLCQLYQPCNINMLDICLVFQLTCAPIWLIVFGGGGSTMGIKNFNLRMSLRKRGRDWFQPLLNMHTPFPPLSPHTLFAPLQLSSQKSILR